MYKTKLKFDGSVEQLKARLVAQGCCQISVIDFDETFTLVIDRSMVVTAFELTCDNLSVLYLTTFLCFMLEQTYRIGLSFCPRKGG